MTENLARDAAFEPERTRLIATDQDALEAFNRAHRQPWFVSYGAVRGDAPPCAEERRPRPGQLPR